MACPAGPPPRTNPGPVLGEDEEVDKGPWLWGGEPRLVEPLPPPDKSHTIMIKQFNDGWKPCARGEFRRLAQELRGRRQRRTFLRVAGGMAAAAVVTGGFVGWWFWPGKDRRAGPLTCS